MNNKYNVYLISDLHGDSRPVRDFWLRAKLSEKMAEKNNVLICLGDFGGNFYFNYRDKNFKEKLGKYPFTYFVIRGNHEERPSICMEKNPDKWHHELFFDNHVLIENDYPYIKYAWDFPLLYHINEYSTMIFPGAYSVDKYYRLQMGWSWFEHEQLEEWEMEAGKEIIKLNKNKCDLVLSHTCPIIFEPTDLFLPNIDQSMVDKTMERYLGEIEFNLDYKAWCWGHFHQHREYPRTDGRRRLMLMHDVVRLEDVINSTDIVEKL